MLLFGVKSGEIGAIGSLIDFGVRGEGVLIRDVLWFLDRLLCFDESKRAMDPALRMATIISWSLLLSGVDKNFEIYRF